MSRIKKCVKKIVNIPNLKHLKCRYKFLQFESFLKRIIARKRSQYLNLIRIRDTEMKIVDKMEMISQADKVFRANQK